ncbi:MAG: hypothetical protein REI64_14625 [Pedobacter sp.]|uniref:hypothetical protein n=1 Tax=Pedobacter sp. TaxID=1411316 RepID=UPI0028074F70|nr:hypothetical protein [Pedobacter sp.]MDQ8006034.1 hypothetical protein [Pedobacter sp.]
MLKKLYLFIFLLLPCAAMAQETYVTGNVFDNEQRGTALQGVSVRNLTSKAVVLTDKDGRYAIQAKKGDLISYASMGYQTDTVYLVNLFPKNIYLRLAVNTLNTVDVTTVKISPYLDTKDPDAVAAKRVDASKEKGGLRLNLGYGKWRKQQAKERELEEAADINEEISKNFNKTVIQKLVNYKEKDLDDYIGLYRPTVEQVKADTPFDYTYYIATTFNEWKKLPADARKLPALPKLKGKP